MKTTAIILILATISLASDVQKLAKHSEQGIIKSEKHLLQIEGKTRLDGKVRSIRFVGENMNRPTHPVLGYGPRKSKPSDLKKMDKFVSNSTQKSNSEISWITNQHEAQDSKNENNDEKMGKDPAKIVVSKRSVDNVKNSSKITDLDESESKVFRPLFVYRQQVNKRKAQQRKKYDSRSPVHTKKYNQRIAPPVRYYPNRVNYY